MTTRRDFLKVGTLSVAGLLINEHVASAKTSQEKGSLFRRLKFNPQAILPAKGRRWQSVNLRQKLSKNT